MVVCIPNGFRIRIDFLVRLVNNANVSANLLKVRSLFKDGKQTAGCTNFCTETRLRRPVSVRNSEHPAICLQPLKRERTLEKRVRVLD